MNLKFIFLVLMFSIVNPSGYFSSTALADEVAVDNLDHSSVGKFPSGWETYLFHHGKAKKVYKVAEDGGKKIIQALDAEDISVPIFKDFDWAIDKYPYLKFEWRAQKLPSGASESSYATNDSACGVYVGLGGASAMKYVWSSTLPVGTYWAKKPGEFYIIVKDTGTSSQGHWKEVTVDVVQDYKNYFQKTKMKTPSGIGLMTDGNATHQSAACDYRNFRISSTP